MATPSDLSATLPLSRRGAVGLLGGAALGAAVLPVLPVPAGAAPATTPPPDFVRASAILTGITLDRSYDQLAGDIWAMLTLHGDADYVRAVAIVATSPADQIMAKLAEAGLTDTARAIMAVWYTGMISVAAADIGNPVVVRICGDLRGQIDQDHPTAPVTGVITYDEALTWRACTFTKPSATCGGPFGYWFNPPA